MLNEILKSIQNLLKVSDKVSDKSFNKSEIAILKLLITNDQLTQQEIADNIGINKKGRWVVNYNFE